MIKIKLELKQNTDLQTDEDGKLIGTKMTNNLNFTSPPVTGASLTADAVALEGLIQQRAALIFQTQQITILIRTARDKCELDMNLDATYVEGLINTPIPPATTVDPMVATAKALTAGMNVASAATPVGPMPKVEGLTATQGDANGSVDLHWNSVKRGLKNYIVEMTDDPIGETGWHVIDSPGKSSATATGLTSTKRYWFRVSANGAAGPGTPSERATKVAP